VILQFVGVLQWQRECVESASSERSSRSADTNSRPGRSVAGRRAVYAVAGVRFPVRRHLGVAQPAERPLREREAAGAKPAAQSNSDDGRRRTEGAVAHPSSVLCSLFSVIRHLLPEGSAEWSATGPENQGDRKVRGSIPQPSAKTC
jgi:hypothetical protein